MLVMHDFKGTKVAFFQNKNAPASIVIGGISEPFNDFVAFLDDLSDTDGLFNVIVMHNADLQNVLSEMDVLRITTKGSVCRGTHFEDFNKLIASFLS